MIYKIYEGLSGYLIAPDGTPIEQKTGEVIPFENQKKMGFTAKLVTDEQVALVKGKKKPVFLVRRFTREELLKMYDKSKNMFNDLGSEVPYTEKYKIDQDPAEWKERKKPSEPGIVRSFDVVPDIVTVPSSGSSIVFGCSDKESTTDISCDNVPSIPLKIPEGMVLEEAGTITQEQMDKLSASKPKVITRGGKKQVRTTEVKSGITTVKSTPVTMKIPFLKIDGVDYQSARKAAEALKLSVNTVLKRAKANKDGWFYIEK